MDSQHHAFYDPRRGQFVLVTMAGVVDDGTPIDPEDGDPLDYFGPVLWRNGDYAVAVEPETHRLALITARGDATVIHCKTPRPDPGTALEPVLGIVLDGGLVQAVISDSPRFFACCRVLIVDYDVEDAADERLHEVRDVRTRRSQRAAVRVAEIEPATIDLAALANALDDGDA